MKWTRRYKLFAECIVVKGFNRSLICDLPRKNYHLIPNELVKFINEIQKERLEAVYTRYEAKQHDILNEYFDFLLEKECIYPIIDGQENNFPDIDLSFEYSGDISNFVLELSEININYIDTIIYQLEKLGCFDIQIKTKHELKNEYIPLLKNAISKSSLNSIDLIIKYVSDENTQNILNYINSECRIKATVFHTALTDKLEDSELKTKIAFTTSVYDGIISCGQISHLYFNLNLELFSESQHHNTCLNRKISVDEHGDIKNCPSMAESFGNISNTSLKEALNKAGFKKYWDVKKDMITSCKDCEFRHICTDCRAFTEDPDNMYSKPLKCGYNPYTNEWEEWSRNPLKQQAFNAIKLNYENV